MGEFKVYLNATGMSSTGKKNNNNMKEEKKNSQYP